MTDTTLTHDGITQPITEWALDYGIYPKVITERLARGWTVEQAIATPMVVAPGQRLSREHMPSLPRCRGERKKGVSTRQAQRIDHLGQSLTAKEWSGLIGVSVPTIYWRLRHCQSVADALKPAPGVVLNFAAPKGTGGGSVAQEIS